MARKKVATRKRTAARRSPVVKIIEQTSTVVEFKDGSGDQRYQIREEEGYAKGRSMVFVEAPCGSEVTMRKDVAIAVANAILKVAESL